MKESPINSVSWTFPYPSRRMPVLGENVVATLEAIADTRGDAFYRGPLAEKIIAHSRANGGAQLIWKMENGYCAASDHRKDGQAVAY